MIVTAEPSLAEARREAAATLRAASSIVISSHVNPDGDAIGSILGTALTLAAAGKRVVPINPDPVPWTFQKLPKASTIQTWQALATFGRPDLWLALDSADESRLGLPEEWRSLVQRIPAVQFDHHITNTRYAGLNIVEAETAACCQQMGDFLLSCAFPVTPDAATCLLLGLTTDSGGFRFSSVTPATFRVAAALMEAGGRQADVGNLLGRRRFASTKLWGLTLQTLQLHANGRIVEAHCTRAMFEQAGLGEEGTEGLVETVRGIEGVDISILFREEADGTIKISFRTSEAADATILAMANGGGGHARAAGCTVPGPLDTARQRIIAQATHLLKTGSLD